MKAKPSKTYSVLIADDEKLECQSLRLFLSRNYPQLTLLDDAMNGSDVVESVTLNKPDILILDIEMPGLNGLEALRLLRSSNNQVRVIIKTAYSLFTYAQNAIQLKVDAYLLKPVKKPELSSAIDRILSELESVEGADIPALDSEMLLMAQSAFVATMVRNFYAPDLLEQYSKLLNIKFGCGFIALVSLGINPDQHANGKQLQCFMRHVIETTSVAARLMMGPVDGQSLSVFVYSETLMTEKDYTATAGFISDAIKTGAQKFLGASCTVTCGQLVVEGLTKINKTYLDRLRYGSFGERRVDTVQMSRHLQKAIAYINLHYMEDISLNQLAEHLDLSPNYVSSLFKNELDKTYVDYLTDVRMLNAISLIKQGIVNIKELSARVGYLYPSYFSKLFKQYTGYSVRDFKRLK